MVLARGEGAFSALLTMSRLGTSCPGGLDAAVRLGLEAPYSRNPGGGRLQRPSHCEPGHFMPGRLHAQADCRQHQRSKEGQHMPYWRLFYHFVWATKNREPLLRAEIRPSLCIHCLKGQ